MKVNYMAMVAAVSLMGSGALVTSCSQPTTDAPAETDGAADPCGAAADPCGAAADPCGAKEDPCGASAP
ncbi:MAG: hypothetical protein AAF329_10575 [Cyanobacteria bacterium P01_A01_bin.17]